MKKDTKTAFAADRCYKITHSLTGKLLTAKEDGSVCVSAAEKGDSQKWLIKEENDALSFTSKLTGKALDIVLRHGKRFKTASVGAVRCTEPEMERKKLSASAYKLISLHADKCADVEGISDEDGAAVQLWDDLGGENQIWKITVCPAAAKKSAAKTAAKSVKPVAEAKTAPAKAAKPTAKKTKKK